MRTFDIADHVGSLKDGKMANIVVWRPAFFGIKPELVIKGGLIAWGAMGDNAASLMTCEPMRLRAQWGAHGLAKQGLLANFVHPLAIEGGFLAHTPDPLVLFPGASLSAATSVTLAAGTCEIIADGIAWHDPTERGRPFEMLVQEFTVGNERSDVLVHERGTLRGEVFLDGRFAAPTIPRRRHRTASRDRGLQWACDAVGCLSGATNLLNGAGRTVRCLARDGGDLRRALDALITIAFAALIGVEPAPRRK